MNCFVKTCKAYEKGGYQIQLENNPFYVDGKGGQLGDRGSIGTANVLAVEEGYLLLDQALEEGKSYPYSLDLDRQVDIAKQHTAQHIFSALAYHMFAWNTVGFRMAEDYSTVDFDTQQISQEQVEALEAEVNDVIQQALPVQISILSSEEAFGQEELRKAISGKIKGDVRMVEIPGVDLCACAGFHVKTTLEISLFKIIYQENVKGKFTRFHFIAGKRALTDYQQKHKITRFFSQEYSCKTEEILSMHQKLKEEKELFLKKYQHLLQEYALFLAEDLKQKAMILDGHPVIFCEAEASLQSALLQHIPLEEYSCIFSDGEKITLHSHHWNCKEIIQSVVSEFQDLKGGGSEKKGNIKGFLSEENWIAFLNK